MEPISWKSSFTFGKYKKEVPKVGEPEKTPVTLMQVLVTDKKWLAWCFKEGLEGKFPELSFIKDNVSEKEWNEILKAG